MSQLETNKPSLPSIQYLLQETSKHDIIQEQAKRRYGHRTSRSISSLPLDLQNLSLQGPESNHEQLLFVHNKQPYNGTPCLSNESPPSWMLPNESIRKPGLNSGGHGRSRSEYSLPPLNTPPPLTPSQIRVTRTHRRAVSANTVDFMLTPSPHSFHRAQSYSPKEQFLANPPATTANTLFEPIEKMEQDTEEGRYSCPFCQKKFSRPSSLRIHTYSHTGEKPFVCTEPGCGRRFSVQSNMRRHLRVHRGRPVNNSTLEITNEE